MNTVELVGRTTKDITVAAKGETKMARFTIAVSEGKDKATFVPVTAFGKTAESMAKYVGKGSLVSVVGHISVGHVNDKMFVSITADKVEFLATKKPQATSVPDSNPVNDETIDF